MNVLTEEIIKEVHKHYDGGKLESTKHFFKEPITIWGLSMPQCKEIADNFYPRVKTDLPLAVEVAGELHRQGVFEVAVVSDYLLSRMKRHLTPAHFNTFDKWVDTLDNWANTDGMCTILVSETVRKDPRLVERLLEWTTSENRWRRRAAAVTLVPIARSGEMLNDVFRITDRLMEDKDDMVQKGAGWLLKEASKKHPEEIREYLLRWRPRTSAVVLRYASEKLPKEKRVLKRG